MARSKKLGMELHCYEKALMGEGSQTLLEATALQKAVCIEMLEDQEL